MSVRYVIRRLDVADSQMASGPVRFRTPAPLNFARMRNLVASVECPLPLAEWDVVEVEPRRGAEVET
jgi:hypothetical protein